MLDCQIQRYYSKIPATGQSSAPCRVILDCVLYPVSAQPLVFTGGLCFFSLPCGFCNSQKQSILCYQDIYATLDCQIQSMNSGIWQSLQAETTPSANTHTSQAHRAAGWVLHA